MCKNMIVRIAGAVLSVGGVLSASAADFPNQIKWKTSVADGYLDDPANWTGDALPAMGQTQTIYMDKVDHDVTLRVGAGTNFSQQAHFYVVAIPENRKVTIDTTGGRYVQAAATYQSNWQGFGFFTSGTSHWCNFESINSTGGAPICSLDDAVLEASRDGSGCTIELKRGTWNCYDPVPGGTLAQNTLMFGNNGQNRTAIFGEGAFFKGAHVTMRGGVIRFTGGNHEIRGNAYIGDAYAYEPRMEVTGGHLAVSNSVILGQNKQVSSRFEVSGTGSATVKGEVQIGTKAGTKDAHVCFRDDATATLSTVYVSYIGNVADADLTLGDRATVTVNGSLNVACASGATGTVTVAGQSTLVTKGAVLLGANTNARGDFILQDEACWQPHAQYVCVGNTDAGATAALTATGNARIEPAASCLYLRASSNGRLAIGGNARITAPGTWLETIDGTNGLVELTGGTTQLRGIHAYGYSDSLGLATNVVRISGGTHTMVQDDSGGYVALTVGNNGTQSRFEMTGGKFYAPRIARVGYGATGSGSAVLRMLGGDFEATPEPSSGSAVVNVCDSGSSVGRIELLGGVLRAASVRGWTGARNKGGTGWATLYADGGTIATIATANNTAHIETFDEALLGEKGLLFDTTMLDGRLNQVFTDAAADVTGRFFKVGSGTLKLEKNSTHGETVAAGGTLTPKDASVTQFGRGLVVTNGAAFSLSGTPTSFTAERLTLGDATSRGILFLDVGDAITLTGTDALKVGRGFIRCDAAASTLGTYSFLRLAEGASVDPAELAKLRILNGSASSSYTFEVVPDGAGGQQIRLTVAAVEVTGTAWTGATSGNWADDGNWNPSVPGASSEATFPADAPNHAVTLGAEAVAHALLTAGGYTFQGSSPLTAGRIAVSSGETTLAAPLSPAASFTAEPADGATLLLQGGVDSQKGSLLFDKTGSGTLTVNAASPDWLGDWRFLGGLTRLAHADALGTATDGTLTLGTATLAFAGTGHDYTRNFTFAAEAAHGAVLKAEADGVLRGMFATSSGGLVKTGAAKMTLVGDACGHTLSAENMDGAVNKDPDADVTLPANGDGPAKSGLGGLTVLEGCLRLEGAGTAQTTFTQKHFLLIGSRYAASANPELEVANCTFSQGGSGVHLLVGGTTPPTTAARAPVLRVVENGAVTCDTLRIGNKGHSNGGTLAVSPTLAVTNGSVSASFAVKVGDTGDSRVFTRVYIGTNGSARTTGTSGTAGWYIGNNTDMEVADGGTLTCAGSSSMGFNLRYSASGSVRVLRGGRITAPYIHSDPNYSGAPDVGFRFDGGELEFTAPDGASVVSSPMKRALTLEGRGLAVSVGSGRRHTLMMPVRGSGAFAKRGAGELVFTTVGEYRANVTNDLGYASAGWTGLSTVEAGTLTLEAGAATNTLAVKVTEGAVLKIGGAMTLGALSGAGTICGAGDSPAALACTVSVPWNEPAAEVPTFENVSLAGVKVDFNVPAGERYPNNTKLAVARLGAGATADLKTWRWKNAGAMYVVDFTLEEDVVYGTLHTQGFLLIVR